MSHFATVPPACLHPTRGSNTLVDDVYMNIPWQPQSPLRALSHHISLLLLPTYSQLILKGQTIGNSSSVDRWSYSRNIFSMPQPSRTRQAIDYRKTLNKWVEKYFHSGALHGKIKLLTSNHTLCFDGSCLFQEENVPSIGLRFTYEMLDQSIIETRFPNEGITFGRMMFIPPIEGFVESMARCTEAVLVLVPFICHLSVHHQWHRPSANV